MVSEPSHDRWMYPSNGTPGTRAQASTFSALPGSSGLDDRWGFFLLAFEWRRHSPSWEDWLFQCLQEEQTAVAGRVVAWLIVMVG